MSQYVTREELLPLNDQLQKLKGWAHDIHRKKGGVSRENGEIASGTSRLLGYLVDLANSQGEIKIIGSNLYAGEDFITRLTTLERARILKTLQTFKDTFGESRLTGTDITPIIGLEETAQSVYNALNIEIDMNHAKPIAM